MNIKKSIENEIIKAAKAKDKNRLSALRMIKAAVQNKEIELRSQLNEEELIKVLSSVAKQRKDSIEQFEKAGRTNLAEKEKNELLIVQEFMPVQMAEDDITAEIKKAITESGATTMKDMGKVMKSLMPKLTGKADGKMVSDMVRTMLLS